MYRRYSQVNEVTTPVSQTRRNLFKNILILLLLAAVITLAAIAMPAVQSRTSARGLFIQRMQCNKWRRKCHVWRHCYRL